MYTDIRAQPITRTHHQGFSRERYRTLDPTIASIVVTVESKRGADLIQEGLEGLTLPACWR
eukprot:7443524-Alexandrium_andersonii.AAC.1